MNIITLLLTCANQKEADTVARVLLEKKLVACVKTFPVSAQFLWQGKVDAAQEIALIMDSLESHFSEIEHEVRAVHSYEQFVLLALPVLHASAGVLEWISKTTSNLKR